MAAADPLLRSPRGNIVEVELLMLVSKCTDGAKRRMMCLSYDNEQFPSDDTDCARGGGLLVSHQQRKVGGGNKTVGRAVDTHPEK